MKHLKSYENTIENELPQPGDYVICNSKSGAIRLDGFIKDNIGIFIGPVYDGPTKELALKMKGKYRVQYQNIPPYIAQDYFNKSKDSDIRDRKTFDISQIRKATPEEIENYSIKINQNKYNL